MKIIRFWFPLVIYSVMIFTVSSLPGGSQGLNVPKIDKILHVIEYFPFGFLLSFALMHTFSFSSRGKLLFFVFLGSFIYGLSDEIHQSFVPLRDASLWDCLADVVGGIFGGYCYYWISKRKSNIN